jgi:hypothetical protein
VGAGRLHSILPLMSLEDPLNDSGRDTKGRLLEAMDGFPKVQQTTLSRALYDTASVRVTETLCLSAMVSPSRSSMSKTTAPESPGSEASLDPGLDPQSYSCHIIDSRTL